MNGILFVDPQGDRDIPAARIEVDGGDRADLDAGHEDEGAGFQAADIFRGQVEVIGGPEQGSPLAELHQQHGQHRQSDKYEQAHSPFQTFRVHVKNPVLLDRRRLR